MICFESVRARGPARDSGVPMGSLESMGSVEEIWGEPYAGGLSTVELESCRLAAASFSLLL